MSDTELVIHAPALLTHEAAARAAVAAIPVTPTSSAFLCLTALPASPEALRAAAPEHLFGRVQVAPILAPYVHTPHCEPACTLRFAPHTHSAACNHAKARAGDVWRAAERRDVSGLSAALAAGNSTEEANPVRWRVGIVAPVTFNLLPSSPGIVDRNLLCCRRWKYGRAAGACRCGGGCDCDNCGACIK